MPIDPNDLRTGGALHGAVAASLVRERERAAELAPGAGIGAFRVLRELGRGGMAIVYLAERADGEYDQQVALKWMLQASPDAASAELFRRERQALADLRHPNIARLLDGGRTEDGRPWFAMEFIDGQPIDESVGAAGVDHAPQTVRGEPVEPHFPVSTSARLRLFLQVCSAVAFAHARGVLHRDIKPSNVLVDADGSAKLLDFGIAQWLGEDGALAARAYTPGYASPEQLRGEALTVASDIYQLGRLLGALLPTPDADLAAIVAKATADDPSRRYATVDAFAADLEASLQHRPVAARKRTPVYVTARFVRRHPFGVAATTLALFAAIALTTAFTLRLAKERDIAQDERARSDAINRFLNEDVLDAANPLKRAPGAPEVTVREALDQAEARVDARFGSDPGVAMNVLTTLGVLRYEFGDDDHALALYGRALAAGEPLPPDDAGRLLVRSHRAALLITVQDFPAAIAELETLVPDAQRILGPGDARTLEWELRLLEARSKQGLDPAFIDELRALRDRAERALGPRNAVSGEASLMAAQANVFSGKPDLAFPDAEYAHAALAAAFGADHPSTLKALAAIAHGHRAHGRGDDAVTSMRRAWELQKARYGPDAGDTLFLQNELAFTLNAVDRAGEAEPLFADLVARRESDIEQAPALYLQALGNLATTRAKLGRTGDALADYDRALTVLADSPNVPPTIQTNLHRGRGDALRELQRFDEAHTALDAAAAVATKLPETDARRLAVQGSRGRLLIAQGRNEEGIAMLDAAIVSLQASVPATHPVLKAFVDARAEATHGDSTQKGAMK